MSKYRAEFKNEHDSQSFPDIPDPERAVLRPGVNLVVDDGDAVDGALVAVVGPQQFPGLGVVTTESPVRTPSEHWG